MGEILALNNNEVRNKLDAIIAASKCLTEKLKIAPDKKISIEECICFAKIITDYTIDIRFQINEDNSF